MATSTSSGGASASFSEAELKRFLDLLDAVRRSESIDDPPRQKFPDEDELIRLDSLFGYQALSALSGRGGSATAVIAQAKRSKSKIEVVTSAPLDAGSTIQVIGSTGTREHLPLDDKQTAHPEKIPDSEPVRAIRIFSSTRAYTAWAGPLPALP